MLAFWLFQKKAYYTIGISLLAGLLCGCNFGQSQRNSKAEQVQPHSPIAIVGNQKLYLEELETIFRQGMSPQDSLLAQRRFAQAWVRKQLFLNYVKQRNDFSLQKIEKKVDDYRNSLILHAFKKNYISQQLDTTVTQAQIDSFYALRKNEFKLREAIIRCFFVVLPQKSPNVSDFETWMAQPKKHYDEIKSYCLRFAVAFSLEDSVWVSKKQLFDNTPFASTKVNTQLQTQKLINAQQNNNLFYIYVLDQKGKNDLAPLSYVRAEVENVIINRRKLDLITKLEGEIYAKAQKDKKFEILF